MKKIYFLFAALLLMVSATAQDTFSIIAVDTVTGEIGGAGASCIDDNQINNGVLIINDIIPGRGGIHTQAYWRPQNQQNAHNRMEEGLSPEQIIDWLVANDVQNNPSIRQYGIVDFDSAGHPRSAAWTGANCDDYKAHITGPNYAIQGNILLGQHILDSMEARFLNTEGMLAEKLMAALQGANVPGADTRCAGEGVSSLSAFVRVAKPGDTLGTYFCDLLVPETPFGVEPIDSLQVLFDEWMNFLSVKENTGDANWLKIAPNPAKASDLLKISTGIHVVEQVQIFDQLGKQLYLSSHASSKIELDISGLTPGIYFLKLTTVDGNEAVTKIVIQ